MSHVFISYSKKDRVYAHQFTEYLTANGFDVWIDDRIDYGEEWERVIFQAIAECAAFVVLMSPNSYASKWVLRECSYADKLTKPQFPVLLAGDEFPRYGPTQFADVRDGSLPKSDFLDELAEHVPRKGEAAHVITGEHSATPSPAINFTPVAPSGIPPDAQNRPFNRTYALVLGIGVVAALAVGALVASIAANAERAALEATQQAMQSDQETATDLARSTGTAVVAQFTRIAETASAYEAADTDNDLLSNREERELGSNPNNPDTDGDGLDDYEEARIYLSHPLLRDTDGDGLTDGEEINVLSTDPNRQDTDGDGLYDGVDDAPTTSATPEAVATPEASPEAEAIRIRSGSVVLGMIRPATPSLWYQFQAAAGSRIVILMERTEGALDPFLNLYSASEMLLDSNDELDDNFDDASLDAGITLIAPDTGVYFIEATGYSDAAHPMPDLGDFRLTLRLEAP